MDTRTATMLLEGLRDPHNDDAWRELDARFRPILIAFARRVGLGAEDSADVAQETFVRFSRSYQEGRFQRSQGRLRSWVFGLARNCIADAHHDRARRRERRGLSGVAEIPGDDRMNQLWEKEFQNALVRRAMEALRIETKTGDRAIRAFTRLTFDHISPAQVAEETGMSMNDVYLAKHRCLKRLREILERIEPLYEHDASSTCDDPERG